MPILIIYFLNMDQRTEKRKKGTWTKLEVKFDA